MELSIKDLRRLEQTGHSVDDFAERGKDGIWRLRNVEGHCFFLEPKTKGCRVYPMRPLGCYIYPVNLGPDEELVIDVLCPAGSSLAAEERKKKGAMLRRHLREIDSQAKHD